jgi:hypothetical protein
MPGGSTTFALMLLLICIWMTTFCDAAEDTAEKITAGDHITILTPGTTARLCPQPVCKPEKHITRIPQGTVLKVEAVEAVQIGTITVLWFEVTYGENRGWISIFDTNESQ